MSEFNNRIDAQRVILRIVNSKDWVEQLYGLSSGAIDRWSSINEVPLDSPLRAALVESASKLFFLANESQQQITEEYRELSEQVSDVTLRIRALLSEL